MVFLAHPCTELRNLSVIFYASSRRLWGKTLLSQWRVLTVAFRDPKYPYNYILVVLAFDGGSRQSLSVHSSVKVKIVKVQINYIILLV